MLLYVFTSRKKFYFNLRNHFFFNFCEKRNAFTPLGIEPWTFRLPVESSIIWATEVPQNFSHFFFSIRSKNTLKTDISLFDFKKSLFSLFYMKEIIFLTLFNLFKKIFIWFKYNTGENLRNNLSIFIIFERRQYFL